MTQGTGQPHTLSGISLRRCAHSVGVVNGIIVRKSVPKPGTQCLQGQRDGRPKISAVCLVQGLSCTSSHGVPVPQGMAECGSALWSCPIVAPLLNNHIPALRIAAADLLHLQTDLKNRSIPAHATREAMMADEGVCLLPSPSYHGVEQHFNN